MGWEAWISMCMLVSRGVAVIKVCHSMLLVALFIPCLQY